jgi:hypothetical protein
MPLLVADCPRCGASAITFDVSAHVFCGKEYGWLNHHEVFSVCRACKRPTIFLISLSVRGRENSLGQSEAISKNPDAIMGVKEALNTVFDVKRHISLQDNDGIAPPGHLPKEIDDAFREGAACYAIGCFNAAGTMFRLCLDHASRPLLPDPNDSSTPQPNDRQRRELGRRLEWLFNNGGLPVALKELAKCVREDGNDGAHVGSLSKEDAADHLDFTVAFLERLITEPKKLELAEKRRKQRRLKWPPLRLESRGH